jgi:hypothetical protein
MALVRQLGADAAVARDAAPFGASRRISRHERAALWLASDAIAVLVEPSGIET